MLDESLETLSLAECDALLRQGLYGRVIYTDRVLPTCTPVNYALDGQTLVFRTSRGSRLALATDHQVVAFEVDQIDPATRSGWTVIITGNAAPITATSELDRVEGLALSTWAPGDRQHWVRITPGFVTGRRLWSHDPDPVRAVD